MHVQQKIQTVLWFEGNAEAAVEHYTSIFRRSKVLHVSRYGDTGPGPKGSVLAIDFQLEGQDFVAMNAGRSAPFTEAISLLVNCDTQEEVDRLWAGLTAGGRRFSADGSWIGSASPGRSSPGASARWFGTRPPRRSSGSGRRWSS